VQYISFITNFSSLIKMTALRKTISLFTAKGHIIVFKVLQQHQLHRKEKGHSCYPLDYSTIIFLSHIQHAQGGSSPLHNLPLDHRCIRHFTQISLFLGSAYLAIPSAKNSLTYDCKNSNFHQTKIIQWLRFI